MSDVILQFSKVRRVKEPARGTAGSAGIDFFVPFDLERITVQPQHRVLIPSGIKANVPEGHALIAMNKSGVATKKGLDVLACVVDSDYQGEIHLSLVNTGTSLIFIEPGEKLVQFLVIPVEHCDVKEVDLDQLYPAVTDRGEGGFGSTGAV